MFYTKDLENLSDSMINPVFQGRVKDGKMYISDRKSFDLWVGQFENKEVVVSVKRKTKPRTTGKHDELGNQNGYLHGVVFPISAKALGYEVEEVKEVFIQMFAPYKTRMIAGRAVQVHMRTSEMNTVQCAEFTDSIRRKMAEMGVIIPDPQKQQ